MFYASIIRSMASGRAAVLLGVCTIKVIDSGVIDSGKERVDGFASSVRNERAAGRERQAAQSAFAWGERGAQQ